MNKDMPETLDVIVIGAGIGGISAANILAKFGLNVLMIEQHDIPGGYCTNFKRKDYNFEASLHMLNGCEPGGMIYKVLEKFNAQNCIEFIKLDHIMRWQCPPKNIDLFGSPNLNDFIKQLSRIFPNEEKNIKKFYKQAMNVVKFMLGWANSGFFGKTYYWFRYFPGFLKFMSILDKGTVSDLIDPIIADPVCKNLITALGGFFGLGQDRMSACIFLAGALSYYLEGAYYPRGGSGRFAKALSDIFETNGGTLLLGTAVTEVLFNGKIASGVRIKNKKGETKEFHSKAIVANCDLTHLVKDLSPSGAFPIEYVKKIESRRPGFSAGCIYLGLDLDLKEHGIKEYEYWISDTISSATTEELTKVANSLQCNEMTGLAMAIYSNIDPSCCPKGKSVVSTIFYATPEPFEKLIEQDGGKKGDKYKKWKQQVAEKYIQDIATTLKIPDLREHVEVIEVATPLTMIRYTRNRGGAFIGWEMTPEQMMLNQLPQKTPVKNIFLTGAWAMPGGGVSACMSSGDACSKLVKKYLKKK